MGGGPESRCIGHVYGLDGAVWCTAPSKLYTQQEFYQWKLEIMK